MTGLWEIRPIPAKAEDRHDRALGDQTDPGQGGGPP